MKILFVGVFDAPWLSTHIAMAKEMENLGHTVVRFDYRAVTQRYARLRALAPGSRIAKITARFRRSLLPESVRIMYYRLCGRYSMAKELLGDVRNNGYDLVFIAKAEEVDYRILPEINKHSKTWYFFVDPKATAKSVQAAEYARRCTKSSATHSDVVALFQQVGANAIFLTQGIDVDMFRKYTPVVEKNCDVVFAGDHTAERRELLDYLKRNGVSLIQHGPGSGNGPIYAEQLVDLYNRSRIILNLNRSSTGFSVRVFQAMGTGSFVLSEYCPDLEQVFRRGQHLDWFTSPQECVELVRYYLTHAHRRESIAEAGYEHVHRHHSWKGIVEHILGQV